MRKGQVRAEKFYEDDKCLVERDRWNFIVVPKPIDKFNRLRYATYICQPRNLLWELCDCRKFFKRESKQARVILGLLDLKDT